jgi:hypothetical protein
MISAVGADSAGAVNPADVVRAAGVRVRSGAAAVLRHYGVLGVLHDLMAVHGVPHTHGARGPYFQNSYHTGNEICPFSILEHLNIVAVSALISRMLTKIQFMLFSVVRSAGWITREEMEVRGAGIQLHVSHLRSHHPAHRLWKVRNYANPNFSSMSLFSNEPLKYTLKTLDVVCSNIYLVSDGLNKREWTYIFGACCLVTIFIPSFRNYRVWSFFGVVTITYTSWYMTAAALVYGQVRSPLIQVKNPCWLICRPDPW